MLTARARTAPPVTEQQEDVAATLEVMLHVVPMEDVLAALARVAEVKRLEARGRRRSTDENVYDLVQGRLELAIDDLKRIGS